MVFKPTDRGMAVIDDETGVKISNGLGRMKWDDYQTRPYYFSEGDMEFMFEAGNIKRRVQLDNHSYNLSCSVNIIEDLFKTELIKAIKRLSGHHLTEEEYQRYKEIAREGMHSLITLDEKVKIGIPDFQSCFEPNRIVWDKKRQQAMSLLKEKIEIEKRDNK